MIDEYEDFEDPADADPFGDFADFPGTPAAVTAAAAPTIPAPAMVAARQPRTVGSIPQRFVRGAVELSFLPGSGASWLAGKLGEMTGIEALEAQPDRFAEAVARYRDDSQAMAPEGFDFARMGGQVAGTLPLGGLRVAQGAARGAQYLNGILQGGIGGALASPDDAASGANTGALVSAVLPPLLRTAGQGMKEVAAPLINRVADLRAAGVNVTPGMAMGSVAKSVEDKLRSVPILGDAITSAQRAAINDYNTAAINMALKPIGEKVPTGVSGRDAIGYLQSATSDAYSNVLKKVGGVDIDGSFLRDVVNMQNGVSQMANATPEISGKLQGILQSEVLNKFPPNGRMDATLFKQIDSRLGRFESEFGRAPDVYANDAGRIVGQVRESLRDLLRRQAPDEASALDDADTAFAMRQRIVDASSRLGADEGVFTPEQLFSAVRSGDRSKGKRAFARGDALMQDFAESGKSILGNKYPDSGTAGRLGWLGLGAGTMVNPVGTGLALSAASLPYLPYIRRPVVAAAAQVPKIVSPLGSLADLLGRNPAGISAALTPGLQQVFDPRK